MVAIRVITVNTTNTIPIIIKQTCREGRMIMVTAKQGMRWRAKARERGRERERERAKKTSTREPCVPCSMTRHPSYPSTTTSETTTACVILGTEVT